MQQITIPATDITERKIDAKNPWMNYRDYDAWNAMIQKFFDEYKSKHVTPSDEGAFMNMMSSVFRIVEGIFQRRLLLSFAASSLLKKGPHHGQVILQEVEMSPGPYSSDGYPAIYGQLLIIQDTDNNREISVSIDSIVEAILSQSPVPILDEE